MVCLLGIFCNGFVVICAKSDNCGHETPFSLVHTTHRCLFSVISLTRVSDGKSLSTFQSWFRFKILTLWDSLRWVTTSSVRVSGRRNHISSCWFYNFLFCFVVFFFLGARFLLLAPFFMFVIAGCPIFVLICVVLGALNLRATAVLWPWVGWFRLMSFVSQAQNARWLSIINRQKQLFWFGRSSATTDPRNYDQTS